MLPCPEKQQVVFLNMLNSKTRILVVDDSRVMRKIITKHLVAMGLNNWIEAADGKEALRIISHDNIDLILSDWNMPRMYGIDLLRAVRNDENTSDIPFIMISAEAQKHLLAQAVEAGVTYYIVKPFTRETLKRGLTKAFNSK